MRSVIVFLLALASSAHAQPDAKPTKSRKLGYALSAAGTAAPLVVIAISVAGDEPAPSLFIGGLVAAALAPSAGHWYAGEAFTTGMGIRIVGGGVAAVSFMQLKDNEDASPALGVAFIAGLSAVAAGALLDVGTAGRAVERWNQAQLAPIAIKDGYGLGVVGRF